MKEIKLNWLIFIYLYEYLALNITFTEILELSLISKSTFKLFQNFSTHRSHELGIIFQSDCLENYIKNEENEELYKFKLIQYKEIKRIKLQIKYNPLKSMNIFHLKLHKKIKENLIQRCPLLTSVLVMNKIDAIYYGHEIRNKKGINEYYDYTENGFYKFQTLVMFIGRVEWSPVSDRNEKRSIDRSMYRKSSSFKYNFNFINNYNPLKVQIKSDYEISECMSLLNCNNLLNFNEIKSIKFIKHNTPNSFIEKLTQLSNSSSKPINIESFTMCYSLPNTEDIVKSFSWIQTEYASTLSKLVINSNKECNNYISDEKQCINFLKCISNSSITTLGLNIFKINSQKFIEPLSNSRNITKLEHTNLETIESNLPIYLNHIFSDYNNNIKTFKFTILDIQINSNWFENTITLFFNNISKNSNIGYNLIISIKMVSYLKSFNEVKENVESIYKSSNSYTKNDIINLIIKNKNE